MNTVLGVNLLEWGIPKEFYKGVSYMIKDFAVRSNKLISRYGPYNLNWLR